MYNIVCTILVQIKEEVLEVDLKILFFAIGRGFADLSYFGSIVEDIIELARSLEMVSHC